MLDVTQRALRGPDSNALRSLLVSNGVFMACLQLLSGPIPACKRHWLSVAVVRTSGALLMDDNARAAFKHTVGFAQLWEAVLQASDSPLSTAALMMEVAVNARLLDEGVPVAPARLADVTVANPEVLLLLLEQCPRLMRRGREAVVWVLAVINVLVERTYYNRTRCCRAGVVDVIIRLLGSWRFDCTADTAPADEDVSSQLLRLLEVLMGHAITPDALARMLNLLYVQSPTFRPDLYLPLQETLRAAACHQSPSDFLDLHGQRSMLWIPQIERSLAAGYTFHVWIRIESLSAPPSGAATQGTGGEGALTPLSGADDASTPLGTLLRVRPSRSTRTRQEAGRRSQASPGNDGEGSDSEDDNDSLGVGGGAAVGAGPSETSVDRSEAPSVSTAEANADIATQAANGAALGATESMDASVLSLASSGRSDSELLGDSLAAGSQASDSPTETPPADADAGPQGAGVPHLGSYEPRLFSFYAPTGCGVEAFFTAGRLAVRTTTRSGRRRAVHTHVFSDSVVPIRRWVALAVVHTPAGSLLSGNKGEVRLYLDGDYQAAGSLPLPTGKEPYLDCRVCRGRDVDENVALNRHRVGTTSLRSQLASVQLFAPLQAPQLFSIYSLGPDHSGAYDRFSLLTYNTHHTLQQMAEAATAAST
jgi:hypothetical protein